ncbi:MAG TPA: DUF2793 domain-containing protein [Allosphingosinicella sp.]|jgi:hypothetical protein
MFHNESLVAIDAALHPVVEEGPLSTPPPGPAAGQSWIVGPFPTGAWAGHGGEIACWNENGWRFIAPKAGMSVWNLTAGVPLLFAGGAWGTGELICSGVRVGRAKVLGERQPAVPNPSGGTTIDAEARLAIAALTAALMSHGLIE